MHNRVNMHVLPSPKTLQKCVRVTTGGLQVQPSQLCYFPSSKLQTMTCCCYKTTIPYVNEQLGLLYPVHEGKVADSCQQIFLYASMSAGSRPDLAFCSVITAARVASKYVAQIVRQCSGVRTCSMSCQLTTLYSQASLSCCMQACNVDCQLNAD